MRLRFFYVAGPANLIRAHRYWKGGEDDPNENCITFSSQFEDFCCDNKAKEVYIVGHHDEKEIVRDEIFTVEHRPKPMPGARGILYHFAQIAYGFSLLSTAMKFRPDVAVIRHGSANSLVMALLRIAGIRIVTILHNTLWPRGFPQTRWTRRLAVRMDGLFFRYVSSATIGVSPECIRQLEKITNGRAKNLYQMRCQYRPHLFAEIPAPAFPQQHPFRIMFSGRIMRSKGVFDVLEMARKVEALVPGRVRWELCGSGPDLDKLRRQREVMGLEEIVTIRGWTSPGELREILGQCHLSIVPTRGEFAEGMAMTAVEAVLSGRPVLTSQVVPALDVLRPACIEARTDDIDSYVKEIVKLIDDPNQYRILCEACPDLQSQFYDGNQGKRAVLKSIVSQLYLASTE